MLIDKPRCEDCIHYCICEIMHDQYGISKVYPSQCGYYQNAADVAPKSEVAREIIGEIRAKSGYSIVSQNGVDLYSTKLYTVSAMKLDEIENKYTESGD